jgi:glutamate formiminotransferase
MGLLVEGRAQVSTNLVDYTKTPLHVVFDEVSRLAEQAGTYVTRSELIGLAPQDALLQAAAHYLKLPELTAQNLVEDAIRSHSSTP